MATETKTDVTVFVVYGVDDASGDPAWLVGVYTTRDGYKKEAEEYWDEMPAGVPQPTYGVIETTLDKMNEELAYLR